MPTPSQDWFDDGDSENDEPELKAAIQKLEQRISGTKLHGKPEYTDFVGLTYTLYLPCGRGNREVMLYSADAIDRLMQFNFEKFVVIDSYHAVCCYDEDYLECYIKLLTPSSSQIAWNRLNQKLSDKELKSLKHGQNVIKVTRPTDDGEQTIAVGLASEKLSLLCKPERFLSGPLPAIRLTGFKIRSQEDAIRTLEQIATSFFFQIDTLYRVAFATSRERLSLRNSVRKIKDDDVSLTFPTHAYDEAPASLYFYARGAIRLPLLQFLAYYQAIEYYFSIYSKASAQRRIRTILKDPGFRADKDVDIARLLNSLAASRSSEFGNERSQLKATLQECLDEEDLRLFLAEDEERKDFLSRRRDLKVSQIPIGSPNSDLISEVAKRIYDIRCKIVHTKATGEEPGFELLLPFSKEAQMLTYDIELIHYVCRRVLITASMPLHR